MAIYIKTNKGVESYVYKWITTISKELWTLAIKYFLHLTVFYRGGNYSMKWRQDEYQTLKKISKS